MKRGGHFIEKSHTQLLVSHFATVEAKVHFHFVAIKQEATGMSQLHVEIVLIRTWTKLNFFDRDDLLVLTGSMLFLFELVLILAVIRDFTSWRFCRRRDLDEIKPFGFSHSQSFHWRENSQHRAVFVDHAHFRCTDLAIYAKTTVFAAFFWSIETTRPTRTAAFS